MALPLSGKQLKNLTTRLREGQETPDDLHALADVLIHYRRVLAAAHTEIERLCAAMPHAEPMAPRVKTLKTTMEKLHRQPELRSLAQIRDLAGMRGRNCSNEQPTNSVEGCDTASPWKACRARRQSCSWQSCSTKQIRSMHANAYPR